MTAPALLAPGVASPARTTREALADAIRSAAIPWLTVYSAPPEHASAPCVILAPNRPYITASNRYGTYAHGVMRLRLVATVSRLTGSGGLDELDDLLARLRQVVRQAGADWGDVDPVGLTTYIGGLEHLTAYVAVDVPLPAST